MISGIATRIYERYGLSFRPSWTQELPKILSAVCRESGVDPEDLPRHLDENPKLILEVAGRLTVNETYFMRHGWHFDALGEHLDAPAARNRSPSPSASPRAIRPSWTGWTSWELI